MDFSLYAFDPAIHDEMFVGDGEPREHCRAVYEALRELPDGQLVHVPDLYTAKEKKTSPVYNEGYRRLGAQNGLNAHFRDSNGLRLVWSLADPVGGERAGAASPGAVPLPPLLEDSIGVRGRLRFHCQDSVAVQGPAGPGPARRSGGVDRWPRSLSGIPFLKTVPAALRRAANSGLRRAATGLLSACRAPVTAVGRQRRRSGPKSM